jgi:hypothetical protein
MKNYVIMAAGLLAFAALPVFAAPISFPECPAVGLDTSGCELLITVTATNGGGIATAFNVTTSSPDLGPFDGSDDTLIGVLNSSPGGLFQVYFKVGGAPVTFAGANGDGACFGSGVVALYSPGPTMAQCLQGHYWTTDLMDYASAGVTFVPSGILTVDSSLGPLAPGESTWFSLPGAITASQITIATPEPKMQILSAITLFILAIISRRRRSPQTRKADAKG